MSGRCENIYEHSTKRCSHLDKVAQLASHHVCQLKVGSVRHSWSSAKNVTNTSESSRTQLNDVTVVGLHKRNIPKKSYYFIILVSWKDGSHVTLYRKSKEVKQFHETLIQEISSRKVYGEAVHFLTKLKPSTSFRILTSLMGTNRRLRMIDKINRYFQALTYYFSDVTQLKVSRNFFDLSKYDINIEKFCKVGKTYFYVSKSVINRRDVIIENSDNKQSSDEQLNDPCKEASACVPPPNDDVELIYEVVDDYVPSDVEQNQNIINLCAREKVEVISKSETGWWFVRRIGGKDTELSGYVPALFLRNTNQPNELDLVDSKDVETSHSPVGDERFYFVAIQSYSSQNVDELSFDQGDILRILRRRDDGWWMARRGSEEGLVPAVRLTSSGNDPIRRLSSKIFATQAIYS